MQNIFDEAIAAAIEAQKNEIAVRPEDLNAFDCGFAWVTIPSKRDPFVKWCKQQQEDRGFKFDSAGNIVPLRSDYDRSAGRCFGSPSYPAGWKFWKPGDFDGQSIRIHEVGAKAFSKVLNSYGIPSYVNSRLD